MTPKRRKKSFKERKKWRSLKAQIIKIIEEHRTLSDLAGISSSMSGYRAIAKEVVSDLEPRLPSDGGYSLESLAAGILRIVKVRFEYDGKIIKRRKKELEERFDKIDKVFAARELFNRTVRRSMCFDSCDEHEIKSLLNSKLLIKRAGFDRETIKEIENILNFLESPEVKILVSRHGNLANVAARFADVFANLAYFGSIRWMYKENDFIESAPGIMEKTWMPISRRIFGANRWDLLAEILSSRLMKSSLNNFKDKEQLRERLKSRASQLGLTRGKADTNIQ